jgi:transcriptional regulator with XRE-family HTH domain
LKPIPAGEVRSHELKNITSRFVEEIDRICAEGRVNSITALEENLLLTPGMISRYSKGRVNVDIYTIQRAKKIYNIDLSYIVMNTSDPEHAGPILRRVDLRKYEGFNRRELTRHAPGKKHNAASRPEFHPQ